MVKKNLSAGKSSVITFRVSEQERQALEKNAQAKGVSVSNYIRNTQPELTERNYPRKDTGG